MADSWVAYHQAFDQHILSRIQALSQTHAIQLLATCPSVRTKHLGSRWADFLEISCYIFLVNSSL